VGDPGLLEHLRHLDLQLAAAPRDLHQIRPFQSWHNLSGPEVAHRRGLVGSDVLDAGDGKDGVHFVEECHEVLAQLEEVLVRRLRLLVDLRVLLALARVRYLRVVCCMRVCRSTLLGRRDGREAPAAAAERSGRVPRDPRGSAQS
jgi:hypothetical protein